MDGVFSLPEAVRTHFLRSLLHSFRCAYISLWQFHSNCLVFLDGFYNGMNHEPSSCSLRSTSVVAERLFNQYKLLTFDVNHECIPGLAFRNQLPYLELQELDLLRLASTQIQAQFFQEARIKVVVFIGCNKGEIELGFSNFPQVDIKRALGSLFPADDYLSRLPLSSSSISSSSSSLIPLSATGSPECSSLLFNNKYNNYPTIMQPDDVPQSSSPHYFHQQLVIPPEGEQEAIIRAFLHVISFPPNSSSTSQPQPLYNYFPSSVILHPEATAFKRYTKAADHNNTRGLNNFRRQSLLNRSFAFFRSLNMMRMRNYSIQAYSPPTQLHHMISERKRREKLNHNFQALRSFLPPATKKDKASILIAAKETLSAMVAEIENLNKRNQQLQLETTTLLLGGKNNEEADHDSDEENGGSLRWNVGVTSVSDQASSSSQEQMVELQVTVRGEISQDMMMNILIRLLEFLKRVQQKNMMTLATNYRITTQGTAILQLTSSLRINIHEGSDEWDESAFEEAVRRVVADFLQKSHRS